MKVARVGAEQLKLTTLGASLDDSTVSCVIERGKISLVEYSPRETLHREEDRCDGIEILLEGTCVIERVSEEGEVFTVANFGPDSLIGGNIIFSSKPFHPHTIVSMGTTRLVRIPKDELFSLLGKHTGFLSTFLLCMSDNSVMINNRLASMVQLTLRQRLLAYLDNERYGQDSCTVTLPITRTRLAQLMGVSRPSLSRELSNLQKAGLLRIEGRMITIL